MKIVWRNPNPIDSKRPSIARTASVEQAGNLLVFYRSSSGLGALGTILELVVYRRTLPNASSVRKPRRTVKQPARDRALDPVAREVH